MTSVATAAETADGSLRVHTWEVGTGGASIARKSHARVEGPVREISASVLILIDGQNLDPPEVDTLANILVTAVRTQGCLRLVAWAQWTDTGNDELPVRALQDQPTNVALRGIAIAQMKTESATSKTFLTAGRDPGGHLSVHLHGWSSATGFATVATANGGRIMEVALCPVWQAKSGDWLSDSSFAVSAVREGSGHLKLIAWEQH